MRRNRALLPFFPAILSLLVLLLAGCKDFSFFGVLGDRLGGSTPLQIAPVAATVAEISGMLTFTATGGTPPYTYSVIPLGGTGAIIPATGAFTAGAPGGVTVRVTDSKGQTSDASVNITATGAALTISPVNVSLSLGGGLTFVASGGTPPYTFSLTASGSGSPVIDGGTGAYTAGITPGTDIIELLDGALDTRTATVLVTTATPTVDYSLVPASFVIPTPAAGGSPVAGASFRLQNALVAGGVEDIYWWVYVSDDGTLGSGDTLLDADIVAGGLGAGAWADVPFGGTWPLSSGAKSLFVMISAADDLNAANNSSSAVPVTLQLPDYQGTLAHTGGTTAGEGFTGTLTIDNLGPADGSQAVSWTVYASLGDTALDADDKIVGIGTIPVGLPASGSSGPLPIAGTWPPVAGSYNLVATIAATDEIDMTGNLPTDGPVVVSPPPVDYLVTLVSSTGPVLAGGSLSGEFFYRNNLASNGTQPVHWIAYVSLDNILTVGTDPVIDSGDEPPLNGATTSPVVSFGGTWPAGAGNRYLFVAVSAADDTNAGNNSSAPSAAVPVILPPVDYQVPLVENTGAVLAGGTLAGRFRYSNNGTSNGTQLVHWIAYVSTDATLDALDPVIDSGDEPALNSAITSGYVTFAGTWPAGAGGRYLFVAVSSSDETVTGNNSGFAGPVGVSLPPVDYLVTLVSSTGPVLAGGSLSGEFFYRNNLASNGTQPVHWIAYVSLDNILTVGTDPVIDSGDEPALTGATTSPAVSFGGTWPAGAGNRYLFVVVSAADDTNAGNDSSAPSAAVPVVLPPVDYVVTAVNNTGPVLAGGPLDGEFLYRNNGSSNGTQSVHWIAYVSLDNTLTVGTDPVIDSGDVPALPATTTSALPVGFTGTWPAGAGGRYLFVAVSSSDETVTGNNSSFAGPVGVSLPPVDYLVTLVSNTGLTKAGGALGGEFFYRNNLASNGTQPVHWIAYVSTDATLDALDPVIDSGDEPALTGTTTSPVVSFGGTWPAGAGDRYLFVAVSAADDTNTANNSTPSAAVAVGVVDYSVAVAHTTGTTAGAAFTGTLTIDNISGAYARDGAEDLYWIVYASLGDAVASPDDTVVAQGLDAAGLAAGDTLGPLAIGGTWPTTAGSYFLVAAVSAGDDANGANDNAATAGIVVGAIDYAGSVTPGVGDTANRPFTGSLTIDNIGSRGGVAPWTWTVYASLGNTSIDAADRVVDSATIAGGLPAGGTSGPLAFGGTWPTVPGNYFLVVEVSAADDYLTGNNRFAIPVTVNPPSVDYTVLNVNYDPTAPSTTTPGAAVLGTFQYRNQGADAGVNSVFWTAYASRNNTLDGSDTWIASGTETLLPGMTTSPVINFSGAWPLDYGDYFLLVMVSELEDANGTNNTVASAATTPIGIYTGALAEDSHEPNEDYTGLTQVYDLGITMEPGSSIYLEGTMANADSDDVLGIKSGSATTFTASMSWGAARDVSLYIWQGAAPPPAGVKAVSITGATSLSISWTALPGEQYWIDITNGAPPLFNPNNIGAYTLVVTAN